MYIALAIVGGLGVILVIWLVVMYNGLVRKRNETKGSFSQIDVQLKRRHDLIPNLVETVKGYASHESETLENVIKARNQAINASGVGNQISAENELTGALSRLMVVVEQYPDLRANQNFLSLQEELTSTENKLGFARQNFNDSVMQYNTSIELFPANVVAGMCGFRAEEYWEIEDRSERDTPKVQF